MITLARFAHCHEKAVELAEATTTSRFTGVVYCGEELFVEKASAYLLRLKVRDLYDAHFLLRKVEDRRKVAKSLARA